MVRKALNSGTKAPKTPIAGTRMAKAWPCKKCGGQHTPPTGAKCSVQASDNSHLSSTLQEPVDMVRNLQLRSSPVTSPVRVVLPPPTTSDTAIEALSSQVDLLALLVDPVWLDINNISSTSVSDSVVGRRNIINSQPVNSCNFLSNQVGESTSVDVRSFTRQVDPNTQLGPHDSGQTTVQSLCSQEELRRQAT